MAEYICREAILDDLEEEIEAGNIALDEDVWINKGLRIAIRDIKDIKTADVQPVKHGKWNEIYHDSENYSAICTYCQAPTVRRVWFKPYDFCPHCGARMDGDAG